MAPGHGIPPTADLTPLPSHTASGSGDGTGAPHHSPPAPDDGAIEHDIVHAAPPLPSPMLPPWEPGVAFDEAPPPAFDAPEFAPLQAHVQPPPASMEPLAPHAVTAPPQTGPGGAAPAPHTAAPPAATPTQPAPAQAVPLQPVPAQPLPSQTAPPAAQALRPRIPGGQPDYSTLPPAIAASLAKLAGNPTGKPKAKADTAPPDNA